MSSANSVLLVATSPTSVASAENGTLATVKFEVVAAKSSLIKLTDVTLFDGAAMPLPVIIVDGRVVTTLLLAVDVNQDGTVNIVDLTLVAQNLGDTRDN